ncbi:MAG: hypothetical protein QOE59_5010 [Actinomycetota bacterium]|nr:hypothetical protein [Actinomycetota bacterium]
MSQFDRIRVTDDSRRVFLAPTSTDGAETPVSAAVDASWERRRAHEDVDAELAGLAPSSGESAVAIRNYADGYVVMGVSGPVDLATARRIGTLLRGLRPHSTRGLLIVLTRLGAWNPHLARVLGQARIHHLIDGGAFELHDAPTGLLTALRADPAFGRPPAAEADPGRSSPSARERSGFGRADRSTR